ncbi:MAG: MFS transporter [Gammaproteobacteria bacterium]|nr:MFS transporter [Gammaproteobacteria bacterium]
MPVSQAIIVAAFAKHQHGRAIAVFGMGAVLGPVVGPVVGGYLSETFNWRWVFFMILPFTGLAMVGALAFIHNQSQVQPKRLDWTGFLSLSIALAALQLIVVFLFGMLNFTPMTILPSMLQQVSGYPDGCALNMMYLISSIKSILIELTPTLIPTSIRVGQPTQ